MSNNIARSLRMIVTRFRKDKKKDSKEKRIFVRGSGYLRLPEARLNEISKVIEEHHRFERERDENVWVCALRRA